MKQKLISWVEIPASDFKRAVKFYNPFLDVDLRIVDCGEEKMACFPNDEGAISFAPGFNPSKDGVLVSLNMEDRLDEALEIIVKNGGSIVRPKTKIEAEGRGYFALLISVKIFLNIRCSPDNKRISMISAFPDISPSFPSSSNHMVW